MVGGEGGGGVWVCVVRSWGVDFDRAGEAGEGPDGEADFGGEVGEEGEGWRGGGGCWGWLGRTCQVRHDEVEEAAC